MTTETPQIILDCGHPPSHHSKHTVGYGVTTQGEKICWDCCALFDKAQMRLTGKTTLYLTQKDNKYIVSNWPGTLTIPVHSHTKGSHNFARVRYDVWFSFEGSSWHGVQYGNNTQIVRCKRVQ